MYSDNLTQKVAQAVAKIMDEELKGNQHKIDANKNGKIDAEDFKLLKKKPVNEVADEDYAAQNVYDKAHMAHMSKNKNIPADKQQAAELEAHKHALATMKAKYPHHNASKGEGQVYRLSKEEVELDEGRMKDIYTTMQYHADKKGYTSHKQFTPADYHEMGKEHGISGPDLAVIAGHKTAHQASVKKEEVEQIDELSKKTLGNYITRNADDQARIGYINAAAQHDKTTDSKTKNKILDKNERQGINRDIGLARAVKKLTKEDQDFINELNKSTLGSYVKRATNQAIVKSLANPADKSDDMKTIDKREKGIRLAVSKLTKEDQDFINELNKSTLGSYVNASARDAVQRTAKEVETGRLDKLADKRMKGIKLATKKLAKEEQEFIDELAEGTYKHEVEKSFPASGVKTGDSASKGTSTMPKDKDKAKGQPAGSIGEGYYKTMDTNRKEDERLAKKDSSPFGKPDKKKTKIATPGKFGYGYSAARHLARQGMSGMTKEESEQVEEDIQKTSTGYIHHARPGVYGGSEKEKHVVDTLRGPKKSELNAIEKEKKMKKSFSEMVELYNEIGLKSLSNMISEEPDNEQFTQELKDQQAKSEGKGKKAEVAKGAVQAVRVEEEVEQIEERSLTEPEMEKKEEIVKSMKKGLSGFKARYGKDAKSVMYATATKQAKGD